MASLPEPQFEEERDKFEAANLGALAALEAANSEMVDFQVAENIKLITVETRDKIRAELPNHELLFQRALAKERRKPGAEGAFKRAFEAVYGKFLFEDDKALSRADATHLDRALGSVLKFPIDLKFGFKGRSELQAAARRLAMIGSQDKANEQKVVIDVMAKEIPGFDALFLKFDELDSLQSKIPILERPGHISERFSLLGDLTNMLDDFDQIVDRENFFKGLPQGQMAKLLEAQKKCRNTIKWIERDGNAPPAIIGELIFNMRLLAKIARKVNIVDLGLNGEITPGSVKKFIDDILGGVKSDAEINKLEEGHSKAVQARKNLDALHKYFSDKALHSVISTTVSDLKKLIEEGGKIPKQSKSIKEKCERLKEQLSVFLKNIKSASGFKLEHSFVELIDTGQVPFPFVTEDGTRESRRPALKELEDRLASIDPDSESFDPSNLIRLYSIFEPFLKGSGESYTFLNGFQSKFAETDNAINGRMVTLNNAKRAKALNESLTDIPAAKRIIGYCIKEAENELQTAKAEKRSDNDIENLEKRVDQLKGYVSPVRWIIDKALGGATPSPDVKTLERQLREAQKEQSGLQTTSEYFSNSDNLSATGEGGASLIALIGEVDEEKKRKEAKSPASSDTQDKVDAMKKILESPFNAQIHQLKGLIESYTEQRRNLRRPSEDALRKELDVRERADKGTPNEVLTRDDKKKTILTEIDTERNKLTNQIDEANEVLERLNGVKTKCEALRGQLATVVKHLKDAKKFGVVLPSFKDGKMLDDIEALLKKIELGSKNFNPDDLKTLFESFGDFFAGGRTIADFMANFDAKLADKDKAVKDAKAALDKAKSGNALLENLTDSQAAKRLIAAIVAEQNPDMSLPDQQKLASMILANDVATIQTEVSYGELAKRGGSELLDTVKQAGFKRKLIGFQYKEGDKTVAPFKGLKPEQFNDWVEIERLFKIGRLNHQNGFFVLAAMKEFASEDEHGKPIPQIQAVKLEKKLKAALAEELGVDERMDEAGIDKILNKAFADQLKKAQELVKAYFQHFERNEGEWNGNKIKELNLRYARVREELRLGKINDATFGKRMAELVEEAKEGEVLDQVKFSEDSAMAGYWNSPFSQWFRDRGWDVGQYAKGKAKSLAVSGVKLGAFGLWGATKLGLSATVQTALLPLRAVKYPLLLAAKPLIGVINLFRRQKWTPLPRIRDAVRSDAGRVVGYFKTKGGETWKGAVGNVTGVPKAEWGKTPYAGKKYKERTKVDLAALKEQADELKVKGDATPVEVAGSPFIDLKKYRDEIAKLDKILAQKPAEERGGGSASGEARAAA